MRTPPFVPKPTAYMFDQLVKKRIDMASIYRSVQREHRLLVNASWTGIEAKRCKGREVVYSDGEYTPDSAKGQSQCATYRLRMLKFLKWAVVNAPTAELKQHEDWINAQFE